MKNSIMTILCVAAMSFAALAQETMPKTGEDSHGDGKEHSHAEGATNTDNTPVDLRAGDRISRGSALTGAKKVSLLKAMKSPEKYAGKNVTVEGVIVRACKMEGCWLELAPTAEAKSIRVKMKDHSFFVPLNSAGLNAKVEGTMSVKTLTKAEVDHLIEDGATFANRNADGSVTEIAFVASGVQLTKKS